MARLPTTRPRTAPTRDADDLYGYTSQIEAQFVTQAERHARRYLWGMIIGWGVAVLFGLCLTWKSMEATVVVHVVEVEAGTGVVRQVSPADVPYVPTDAAIARQVREVLLATRGLSTDPVMIHRQWDWAFSVVT